MPDAEYGGPAFANDATNSTGERSSPGYNRSQGIATALRGMNYEQGKQALSPCEGGGGTFLHDLFNRMDSGGGNSDCKIDRSDIIAHLERAGLGRRGLIPGGIVRGKVADGLLAQLGKDKNGSLTWGEVLAMGSELTPSQIFDDEGAILPSLLDEVFARIDTKSDQILTEKEIKNSALDNLPEDAENRKVKADVTALLALEALDFDKSGGISKAEFIAAAADVSRTMDRNVGGGGDR